MFLAFAVSAQFVLLFDLKIKVCAVVVQDFFVPGMDKVGILVEFTLYKIGFLSKDGKGTVNIL